jgi:hypothetical protein
MMSHYNLVDGTEVLSNHDVSEEMFNYIETSADLISIYSKKTAKGVSIECYDERERYVSLFEGPGLYLIYKKSDFNQYECIYAGTGNIRYRIYRFMKELYDMSRDDETHSAAKKARRYGVDKETTLYVRYITQGERDSIIVRIFCKHLNLDLKTIDEHIAHIAKARFNKRIKKA